MSLDAAHDRRTLAMAHVIQLDCRQGFPEAEAAHLAAGDSVEMTGRVLTLRDASAARLAPRSIAASRCRSHSTARSCTPSDLRRPSQVRSSAPRGRRRPSAWDGICRRSSPPACGRSSARASCTAVTWPRSPHAARSTSPRLAAWARCWPRQITAASVLGYEDLGPEALYALDLVAFPAVVIIDRAGRNFHETARAQWRRAPERTAHRQIRNTDSGGVKEPTRILPMLPSDFTEVDRIPTGTSLAAHHTHVVALYPRVRPAITSPKQRRVGSWRSRTSTAR